MPAKKDGDKYRYVVVTKAGLYWTGKGWSAEASQARRYKKLPATLGNKVLVLKGDQSDWRTLYYQWGSEKVSVKRTRVSTRGK